MPKTKAELDALRAEWDTLNGTPRGQVRIWHDGEHFIVSLREFDPDWHVSGHGVTLSEALRTLASGIQAVEEWDREEKEKAEKEQKEV